MTNTTTDDSTAQIPPVHSSSAVVKDCTRSHTVTRFAPSPTGLLHLGHAKSALFAYNLAKRFNGRAILRIEDIDTARSKPEYVRHIQDDMDWLGLSFPLPWRVQSRHMADYKNALDKLDSMGLLYRCYCTRKDIRNEIARAASAPHGPDGAHYPGLCKNCSPQEQTAKKGQPYALRLDMEKAVKYAARIAPQLSWTDIFKGTQKATPEIFGDVVLARKDVGTSYHLSVVVDDAIEGVTVVTRGQDLFFASHLHCLLQTLLGLPVPLFAHHGLICDAHGKRLAKRDNAASIETLRQQGKTPAEICADVSEPCPV